MKDRYYDEQHNRGQVTDIEPSRGEAYPSIRDSISSLHKFQEESFSLLAELNSITRRTSGIDLTPKSHIEKHPGNRATEPSLCEIVHDTVHKSALINRQLHELIQTLNQAL